MAGVDAEQRDAAVAAPGGGVEQCAVAAEGEDDVGVGGRGVGGRQLRHGAVESAQVLVEGAPDAHPVPGGRQVAQEDGELGDACRLGRVAVYGDVHFIFNVPTGAGGIAGCGFFCNFVVGKASPCREALSANPDMKR